MARKFKKAPKYRKGLGHECRFSCGREAVYIESDTCDACNNWFQRWMKAGPTKFFKRKKNIEVLVRRADELATPREVVKKTGTRG